MPVRMLAPVVALAAAVSTTGCITFEARPMVPSWTASSHIQQQEISKLSVAARALGSEDSELQLIGRPARDAGFFPLVLLFENQGDAAFLLRREGIQLETSDGHVFEAAEVAEVFEGLRWSHGISAVGVPLGIFPAFMISARVSSQNRAFHDDLRTKAFRDLRLYSNPESYNCLVFFRMEPDQAIHLDPGDCWLSVEVERQATEDKPGEVILFRLVPEESSL